MVEHGDLQRLIDADLPVGWTDEQGGGKYRLKRRSDDALFGYNVGPHSWKKFLHPPNVRLSQVTRDGKSLRFMAENDPAPKFAFIGVRSCDLRAIQVQDKVFLTCANCTMVCPTCFCTTVEDVTDLTGEHAEVALPAMDDAQANDSR
jgi:hypothetical protein